MSGVYMPRALYNPGAATHFTPGGNQNSYNIVNNYANGMTTTQTMNQNQWDAYSRRYGGLSMNPMYYQNEHVECNHNHHCHNKGMPDWMKYGVTGLGVLNGLIGLFKPDAGGDNS